MTINITANVHIVNAIALHILFDRSSSESYSYKFMQKGINKNVTIASNQNVAYQISFIAKPPPYPL